MDKVCALTDTENVDAWLFCELSAGHPGKCEAVVPQTYQNDDTPPTAGSVCTFVGKYDPPMPSQQPTLPPDRAATVSLFSLTDSLGINSNLWPDILNSLESRPESALLAICELRDNLDALEANAVGRLRAAQWSWARIAGRLGVTRQAVQKRYPDVE